MFMHFIQIYVLYFCPFSLGCGIGYGYLHRIPTLPFSEGKKISFPAHGPIEPGPPPKDGFTEVAQHRKQRNNSIQTKILFWFRILWTFTEMS